MYLQMMENPPEIRELRMGGGTSTFFSPQNLNREVQVLHGDLSRYSYS